MELWHQCVIMCSRYKMEDDILADLTASSSMQACSGSSPFSWVAAMVVWGGGPKKQKGFRVALNTRWLQNALWAGP